MSHRSHFIPNAIATLLAACGLASVAQAAIYTVGSGAGCTHGTIQSAIDAANASAGADTVRLTRSLTYEPEANTIDTAQELTIEGGYATCDQASADTTNTVVSGAGGAQAPVFTITAPMGAFIHLRRLSISGGDTAGGGKGGGIRFEGDGILELQDCGVTGNIAGYGGGIHATGTGSHAELVLGANVVIGNNTARYDGGGVLAKGIEMSMTEAGSSILNNQALGTGGTGGFGGGLFVHAVDRPSYAYIGSGAPTFGPLWGNDAAYGGGVAILSQGSDAAELQLFTTDPAQPARMGYNAASALGGALYVSSSRAAVRLWNATLDNNLAANGAAAYLAAGAGLYVNFSAMHAAAVGCAVGDYCGRITHNTANTDANPGAILYGEDGTTFQFGYLPAAAPADPRGGVLIRDNTAASVFGGAATTQVYRSLIVGNTTSSDVIKVSGHPLALADCTIAGNTIGGGSAILRTVDSDLTIHRSILWQPGSTVLSRSGGSLSADYSVANENISLDFDAYVFDPRFTDPATGDYGLRGGSRAIDFSPAFPGNERDALGQPRDVDIASIDRFGPRDVGALERQVMPPLVLNSDFNSDLHLWNIVAAGTTSLDTTQNASGPAGSGSAYVTRNNPYTGQETRGLAQCVHLPAPALYELNGWGRGTGSMVVGGDKARLYWEYRRNGGEDCSGAPDTSGWLDLTASSSWRRPAEPAQIDIDDSLWGDSPSITVILTAVEQGPGTSITKAWFDGITLAMVPANDAIFANGFEPN